MDLMYQVLILVVGIFCLPVTILKTRDFVNPVTLIYACFFLPSFFATFRLSGLQSSSWQLETYFLLFCALITWIVLPTLLICYRKSKIHEVDVLSNLNIDYLRWKKASLCLFWFVLLIYISSNVIQSGLVIPAFNPEVANEIHHVFPPIIGVFARFFPLVALVLFICYAYERKKIYLILIAVCFLVPFSRLSRIDFIIQLVALIFLNAELKIINFNKKHLLLLGFVSLILFSMLAELGSSRVNRFGEYSITYFDVIDWKGSDALPESIPIIYAYFPLSFENLDHFVMQLKGHTYGLASFEWISIGFLKLHMAFPELKDMIHIRSLYDPISTGVTVPTALATFYLDFGVYLSIFPMLLYMFFYMFFYFKKTFNSFYLLGFCLFSYAFSLASFQSFIVHPNLYWQLLFCFIIYFYTRRVKP